MTFPFTLFKTMYSIGREEGDTQRVPFVQGNTWEEYLEVIQDAQRQEPIAKSDTPCTVHGYLKDGLRDNLSLLSMSAMALDCDGAANADSVRAFLDEWPYAHLFQRRWTRCDSLGGEWGWKYHLVFPFGEPVPHRLSSLHERRAFSDWVATITGHTYDPAQYKPVQVMLYYAPRIGVTQRPITEFSPPGTPFLDWELWLEEHEFQTQSELGGTRKIRTLKPVDSDHPYLQAFARMGPEWVPGKGAYSILCPHPHQTSSTKKTLLYLSDAPHIRCMSGDCQNQPISHFINALEPDEQNLIYSEDMRQARERLGATSHPMVSLPEAQRLITEAFQATRPVERNATVVRVTTGAGKSHAALQYLSQYTTPLGEDVAGRTAILATPTNDLSQELSDKLQTPHRRQTGVLAVLNEDGSPACKKHEAAKALQQSGGNIHLLMCSKCEFKEGCPARENRETGDGTLTLTNHALMTPVAGSLHEKGRHPLLVWDESPPMVLSTSISLRALNGLVQRFDDEARPTGPLVERMLTLRAFPEKYRAVIRPLLAVLRDLVGIEAPETGIDPEAFAEKWCRLPLNKMMMSQAIRAASIQRAGTVWETIRAAIDSAAHLGSPDIAYDQLLPAQQAEVRRTESTLTALKAALRPGAKLFPTQSDLYIVALSPDAVLFQNHGGLILDATANLSVLASLRPDLRIVDIRVEDAGTTVRRLIPTTTLSRANLKWKHDALHDAVHRLKRELRGTPKTVCFTYKSHVEAMRTSFPEFEWGYYGNVRGYDRFFQEGFDVFATFGDPVPNLTALKLQWAALRGTLPPEESSEWRSFVQDQAQSEVAQAHGRARSPQHKLGSGDRFHFHFGKHAPLGWDLQNADVAPEVQSRSDVWALLPGKSGLG